GHATQRQFTFARCRRIVRNFAVSPQSVSGIDRTSARAAIATRIGTAGDVVRILDAVEKAPRRGGLTLLVARKGAVAETRIVVALNTIRVAGADSLGWRGADHCQPGHGHQSQNYVAHEKSPLDRV